MLFRSDKQHGLGEVCPALLELFHAEWVVLVDSENEGVVGSAGAGSPEPAWLAAFVAGSRHLDADALVASSRSDLAWAEVPGTGLLLAMGRALPQLRVRERRRLSLFARMLGALLA